MFDDKEPSSEMQTRMLIAFALSALVLLFFAPKPGARKDAPKPPAAMTQSAQTASTPPAQSAAPVTKSPAEKPGHAASSATSTLKADNEKEIVVESDLYEVHLSNKGGVATNWFLTKFKDANGKRLDVVNPLNAARVGWPMSIYTEDAVVRNALAGGLFVANATSRQAPAT